MGKVPDPRGGLAFCGRYDTQLEAAKVADIARLLGASCGGSWWVALGDGELMVT